MTQNGLEAVYLDNRTKLRRFLCSRCGTDDVDDVLQELWLRISAASTGPVAEPLSYLYRMASNLVLDRQRAAISRDRRDNAWWGVIQGSIVDKSQEPSAERAMIARERLERAETLLSSLGSRTETIFRRYRLDDIPQRQIASELGVSLSTVEKELKTAYTALIALQTRFDTE